MKSNNIFEDEAYRTSRKNEFDGNLVHGAKKYHLVTNRNGDDKPNSVGHSKGLNKVTNIGEDKYQPILSKWESVNICPVCNSSKNSFYLQREALKVYRCANCDHRFLNPRIKFSEASILYSEDSTAADIYNSSVELELNAIQFRYVVDVMKSYSDDYNKILDIGCGNGLLLKTALKQGYKYCIGVDINQSYQNIKSNAISPGLSFYNMTFDEILNNEELLGNNYDCISMWFVLEHIYDIKKIVRDVYKLLKKGGVFVIGVPNAKSLATRIIREKSPTYNWKHVSYFTKENLNLLLENAGFEEIFSETLITEIDNIKSYLSGEHPYEGIGDTENIFDFITPEFIYKNSMGSKIFSIFKK